MLSLFLLQKCTKKFAFELWLVSFIGKQTLGAVNTYYKLLDFIVMQSVLWNMSGKQNGWYFE